LSYRPLNFFEVVKMGVRRRQVFRNRAWADLGSAQGSALEKVLDRLLECISALGALRACGAYRTCAAAGNCFFTAFAQTGLERIPAAPDSNSATIDGDRVLACGNDAVRRGLFRSQRFFADTRAAARLSHRRAFRTERRLIALELLGSRR